MEQSYLKAYKDAKRAGAQPGRNIVADDVQHRRNRTRDAREREVRRSLVVLRRMVAPAPASNWAPTEQPNKELIACTRDVTSLR